MRAEVATVKRLMKRTRLAVENLSNQVFILQDRVDSNRTALKRRTGKVELPEEKNPDAAPEGTAAKAPVTPAKAPVTPAVPRADPSATEKKPDARPSARIPVEPERRPRLRVVRLRPRRARTRRHRRRRRRVASRARRPVLKIHQAPVRPVLRGGAGYPPLRMGVRLPVVPIPSTGGPLPASGPIEQYKEAYGLYLKGKTGAAAVKFSRFARQFPKHDYADNALFWLGQCMYRQGKFRKALWVFRKVVKRYPSGNKAPDSLLKMGLSYRKLGQKDRSRKILVQVVKLYPGTRVARVAAKALKALKAL